MIRNAVPFAVPAWHPSVMKTRSRYRWRTVIRPHLPWFLINRGVAGKGKQDCGLHEWYRSTDREDLCYHCELGIRRRRELA